MSDLKINNITNRGGNGGPVIAGVSTVSTSAFMVMPSGDTEIRGAGSGRAVFARGSNPGSYLNTMDYVTISSTGNAIDFGDSSDNDHFPASCASSTRGLIMGGGGNPAEVTLIEYVTISSSGGAQDFGDLRIAYYSSAGLSNSIRGIIGGGQSASSVYNTFTDFVTIASTSDSSEFGNLTARANMNQLSAAASSTRGLFAGGVNTNLIEFVTISSAGNGTDFGSLTIERAMGGGSGDSTRGIIMGGGSGNPSTTKENSIDFITIATLGDAQDFGDLANEARTRTANLSSSTRAVVAGGYTTDPNGDTTHIDFVTIQTKSNATDFGDLTSGKEGMGGASSETRGLFAGGTGVINTIDFITIATTGNAADFGDMNTGRKNFGGFSDAHGGLGE